MAPAASDVLQVLRRSDADLGTALFVHAVDGGAGGYLKLATLLSRKYTCLAAIARNFSSKPELPDTITDMARLYVDQALTCAPSEIRTVIGWSNGGWIALEIAVELARRSQTRPLLIVMDTVAQPGWLEQPDTPVPARDRHADAWWRFISLHLDPDSKRAFPTDFWSLDEEGKAAFLLENCRNTEILSARNYIWLARSVEDVLFLRDMTNKLVLAMGSYTPSTYDGEALIFYTEPDNEGWKRPFSIEAYMTDLWSRRSGKSTFIKMGGTHSSIVRSPFVDEIADRILSCSASID